MAFGFTPKHQESLDTSGLEFNNKVALLTLSIKKLKWNPGLVDKTGLTASTPFSWKKHPYDIKVIFVENSINIESESTGSEMYDWGRNKKNVELLINTFNELKETATQEQLDEAYNEIKEIIEAKTSDEDQIVNQDNGNFFMLFIPNKDYFITPIILVINIIIFGLMMIDGVHIMEPSNEDIFRWGANIRPATIDGDYWRLLTSCFIHIGIFHLLMNMYALIFVGALLEPYLGKFRFLSAYLLSGVVGSIASIYWHDLTLSAGASGAVFGMHGVFLALLTTNVIEKGARKSLFASIGIFVGYNLLYGLKGGIDNAAHIGGLVSGIIIGYAYYITIIKKILSPLKYAIFALLSLGVFLFSYTNFDKLPQRSVQFQIEEFQSLMSKFTTHESLAMTVYRNMNDDANKDFLMSEIKDRGLYYWEENLTITNKVKELYLPGELYTRNEILQEYCLLRKKSLELIYKKVEENSDKYDPQIERYHKQIEETLAKLKNNINT